MLNTILVITTGTSDVQITLESLNNSLYEIHPEDQEKERKRIVKRGERDPLFFIKNNRNKEDSFLLQQPRNDGARLLELLQNGILNYELPLIAPVIEKLKADNQKIDLILIVYTDQPPPPETFETHYQNDTIFFKDLIKSRLASLLEEVDTSKILEYKIGDHLTDIDYNYNHFGSSANEMLPLDLESLKQVILLAQGGIDQINQAITLQLIRKYGLKVKLYQKSESSETKELRFPSLFLQDLNNEKIRKHIQDYDFGLITKDLVGSNKVLFHLAQCANERLNLRHDNLSNSLNYLQDKINASFIEDIKTGLKHDDQRLKDIYCSMKINLLHGNLSDFIWRLFTLSENLFKVLVQEVTGDLEKFYRPEIGVNEVNEPWEDKLKRINDGLIQYLKTNSVRLNNPNRRAYFFILIFLIQNDQRFVMYKENLEIYKRLAEKIELMSKQRNRFAHNLYPIKKEQLIALLGNSYNISGLVNDLDVVLNISGLGIYDRIREKMLQLLFSN